MSVLKSLISRLLILGPWPSWGGAVPDQIVVEGMPPLPLGLAAEVSPYLEYRVAAFQDWHPRRRDVLITTRFADTAQLHLVQLPGGARRQLTFLGEPVSSGTFQPTDGSRIVFVQDTGGREFFQLYRWDGADGTVTLLTDGQSRNTGPRWARRSGRLAYASTRRNGRDTDVYVMDPARPESDRRVAELSGSGWSVQDWSPDETQLLALSYVSINESYLHLIQVATGERRLLTPVGDPKTFYAGGQFTRDGRSLLVVTDRESEFWRLARLDLATGLVQPLGDALGGDVEAMDLSPDGRTAALLVNERGPSALHFVDVRSGRERRVPRFPTGVGSGLRWHSNNHEVAMTLSSAKTPGDVYSFDVRVNATTRWTESETGSLDSSHFAEPELVQVRSFDGLEVSGILYRPDAVRFPGRRPVLMVIHGGPESQSRPVYQGRWNFLIQELGIAVLHPNVRGSAGFGKTFLTLDNGLKREDSVKDLGAFLDWLAGQPSLDPERVGVYGGSYGGYMVLAALAQHGNRLRCGIDVVGISNFLTFLQNTQDYRRDLRRIEYGDERDPQIAEFLGRISPLAQVSRIRQPLLIAQGRNDPRVPVTEAEQMVQALRAQGGEVWYIVANDEGHGFAKKKNSDFAFEAMVEFLRAHLLN